MGNAAQAAMGPASDAQEFAPGCTPLFESSHRGIVIFDDFARIPGQQFSRAGKPKVSADALIEFLANLVFQLANLAEHGRWGKVPLVAGSCQTCEFAECYDGSQLGDFHT